MKTAVLFLFAGSLAAQITTYPAASGGSGGTPGGSTTQLQYNNAGAFGGAAGITTADGNNLLATSFGSSSWQLLTTTLVPTFQGVGTANTVVRLIQPAAATANSILSLENTSDSANAGRFRLINAGAGATPALTGSLQSGIVGTGTGITTQNFGEDSSAATLTTINWQFNGVTQMSATPTSLSVPTSGGITSLKTVSWTGAYADLTGKPTIPTGTVTSVATTGPITGGTITGTGTIACATCATAASGGSLTTSGAFAITLTSTATTGVTLPTTGTLATLAGSETLSGKTLTTPIIGQINDTNGIAGIILATTASAVNQLTITDAATATNPVLSSTGTDATVGLDIKSKGANSRIRLLDSSGNPILVTNDNQGDARTYVGTFHLCQTLTATTLSGMGCGFQGNWNFGGYALGGQLANGPSWRGYGLQLASNAGIGWATTTNADSGTYDLGITRNAAGVAEVNDGTACSTASHCRALKLSALISGGTTFIATGLSVGTLVGGATAGTFALGANGPGTVVVTMGNSATAPTGWSCWVSDRTTLSVLIEQSASTTTTATFNFPAGALSGDVSSFGCLAY